MKDGIYETYCRCRCGMTSALIGRDTAIAFRRCGDEIRYTVNVSIMVRCGLVRQSELDYDGDVCADGQRRSRATNIFAAFFASFGFALIRLDSIDSECFGLRCAAHSLCCC